MRIMRIMRMRLLLKKVEFDKTYEGPKHYFPGDAFNYNFDKCQINQSKK